MARIRAAYSYSLAASVGAVLLGPFAAAGAQEAAQQQPAAGVVEEVVVIGTPGGAGIDRQDVSFAVTTVDALEINKFSPQSTADLFKTIPGVWVESSGGVSGANIDVRGLPGGGDAPFVTLAINGSPIYGTEMLSFMEQSTLFRIDETIANVQALRGGPNAVFGKGEPGLTVNFNLKEGSELTEGRVKYSTSDYGLQRLDGVLSGKLAEDFYYMVGGYIQSADGIRDAQFKAEEGDQFTINLTRSFGSGEINLFARMTDDHGQWILPMALNTGNDLGNFAQLGNATRFRQIQTNFVGNTEIFDFANGRGWDGLVTGGSAEFDFGEGWTIRDQFTFTTGDADTFGFVPAGAAVTAADLSAVIGGPVTTVSGMTVDPASFVQTYGHWVVMKDLESRINDISIKKEFANLNELTFGYYQATWSSDDFWLLGNPIPVHHVANGEPLDPSITPADIAAAGGGAGFEFGLQSAGDARADALYVADSFYATDQLRIDLGVRREWFDLDYVLDTSDPDDPGPGVADGIIDQIEAIDEAEWAYTAAVNYDISDALGIYGRFSDGYLFPHFDRIREARGTIDEVRQFEGGVKYTGDWLEVYSTAFFNQNDSFQAVVGGADPAESFETEAYGIEVDGSLYFEPLTVSVVATFQDTEITDSTTAANIGNQVLRQPDFQLRIAPSYVVNIGAFETTFYGALTLVDDRFGENANTTELPSYEKFDLGVLANHESGLFFQIHADNINDEEGITEGDPRNPAAPNGRPIFGRSFQVSVGYDF